MRLTDRSVSRLRGEGREYVAWDSRTRGLGVRIRPSGYRAFVFLDNRDKSSGHRHTLGSVATMTVEQARALCRDIEDGSVDVRKQSPTLQDFVATVWKTERQARCKPSTRRRQDISLRTQLLPTFGAHAA